MRYVARLFFCTCLLFAFLPAFATGTADLPLGVPDHSRSQAHLNVTRVSPELTSVALESPEIVTQNEVVDFQNFQAFNVSGEYTVLQEGSPTVPQVSRFYRIPDTGGADLVITDAEYDVVDNVNPYPVQAEESGFQSLTLDDGLYSADGWYPSNVAVMSAPMIMRDFRVVVVTLYPVQVNPVTHQARVYRNLSADIVANDQPGVNEITHPRRPTGSWAPIYREMITNLDDNALDNMTTTPGSYMILAKSSAIVLPFVDSLRVWKTRCGYTVIVDTLASWSVPTMTSHIRTRYANADPPLEFVALMGDPSAAFGVPTDATSDQDFSGNYDHTFALGNANDDIEDIGCGRLSGSTGLEMATINAKIMGYERTPYMADTTWFKKGFFYGSIGHNIASNWTLVQWAAQQFHANTGIVNNTVSVVNGHVDDNLVRTQFNGGIGLFFWRGSWLSEMENTLAGSMNNGWRLPVCLCMTCMANQFSQDLGIAESYLVAGSAQTPKGGVCAIGTSTSGTHAPQNVTVAGGVAHAIADLQIGHIGHALNAGKIWLILSYGAGTTYQMEFTRWNNLMGEPGISVWTDVPVRMNATYPAALNVGARNVHVVVSDSVRGTPIANALVVLWKPSGTTNEVFVKGLTDSSGAIDLPVYVTTPGDLQLTITKRNHKPFLYTILCSTVDRMVAASTTALDDDNTGGTHGNGDGQMNPGETIDLRVYLLNFGSAQTATNISATLVSENPHLTVVQGSGAYPNLAPGDSALPTTNFRVTSAPTMVRNEHALLLMAITASGVQSTCAIDLVCQAGRLDYVSQLLSDTLNPGTTRDLTVTLRNNGTLALAGVTATLVSLSPFVSVVDATGTFGDIGVAQQASNSADRFTLRSNSQAYRGRSAPLRLIATTSDGVVDTVQFTVSIGRARTTDPTGPDAYGYYAYDNTDTSNENHPAYNYIDIAASGGTNLSLNDPGLQIDTTRYTAVRALPFRFTFYGRTYDTITVCSNGWVAFGNQAWNTAFRNFPIPMMQAPEAMIAPYFDDLKTQGTGLGVWFMPDAANHRCVVQWKANGAINTTPLDFEVILYDSASHPSRSGNNALDMQYRTVTLNFPSPSTGEADGESIGIQAPGDIVGLQYAWQLTHSPGAATVANGRAIRFTTEAHELFGSVAGTVTDAANTQPLVGATVTLDGFGYRATTDASGHYLMQDVLVGTYDVRAQYRRYNDAVVSSVNVLQDDTAAASFSLHHPEMALSVDSLVDSIGAAPSQTIFNIINAGNGPLDYDIHVFYAGDENPNPWDSVGNVAATQLTGNYQLWGCEFAAENWWVTGSGSGSGPNLLYRFDRDGNLVSSIPQPSTSGFGWFDLAYDGHYLYGSDSHVIYGIDLTGQVRDTIPSPLNPTRALAYDSASGHFWVADYTSDIYELDRQGGIVSQVSNVEHLAITGLAWNAVDANGYKLYIFSLEGSHQTRITRMLTTTPYTKQTVVDLAAQPGDRAGGCAITPAWNSTLLTFGGILRGANGPDHLGIYEMVFNTTWISVTPAQSSVPGGNSAPITVHFDPASLRDASYRVNMHIASMVYDTTLVLPVRLVVDRTVTANPHTSAAPTQYALRQNYPNPFNPTTQIAFDLPKTEHVQLSVYNSLGQKVAVLLDEMRSAGSYTVIWDGRTNTGADVSTGLYFYRIKAGGFISVKKMLLMR